MRGSSRAAPRLGVVAISRLDVEGDGVAEIDGGVVRVPRVIPGERVEVQLLGRDRAEPVRVLAPSPHRVVAPCRHFGPCGGCSWQHIAYAEQLRLKQRLVERLLREALAARAPEVLPTLPTPPGDEDVHRSVRLKPDATHSSDDNVRLKPDATCEPTPWHYRDKVAFVFGPGGRAQPLVMGHYRRASRIVVPVVECPVHAETGNRVAFAMRDALAGARIPGASGDAQQGIARHVVVRVAEADESWLATLVVTGNVKPLRRVTERFLRSIVGTQRLDSPRPSWGLYLNVHDRPGPYLFGPETTHLAGARDIRDEVAAVSYVLSPTSFFQTNVRAARVLAAEVLDALADRRFARILDLYAGVGLFALPLARDLRTVTAVEENRDALAAAAAAARRHRIPERAFRTMPGRVEHLAGRLTPRTPAEAWDAVVIDPPREGCPRDVLDWLVGTLRPARIVYVSCNPEALARDLRALAPAAYVIRKVQPIDMFPHTAHVETVVVLDKKTK